jgi:hypothetical protein
MQDHYKLLHLTHYFEGYRDYILIEQRGCNDEECLIDEDRYSPDSASEFSYLEGWKQAEYDFNKDLPIIEKITI